MSLSTIIKKECPTCGKLAVESSRLSIGKTKLIKLVCGHLLSEELFVKDELDYFNLSFADGSGKPRPYQIDCIKFLEQAGFRAIIADQQGTGKTVECLCTFKLYPEKLLPAVLVPPSSVKVQWLHEIRRICGNDPRFLTQVILSGKEKAMPGFGIYIITYDMLKKDDVFEYVPNIKTLVLDECQRIKNHLSERAKAVQRIADKCEYIIPMSGTPIKNHAGEYFTVLNLVAPTRFPHYQTFLNRYTDSYESFYGTKVGGLKDIERFQDDTRDIIIRRTKDEVLADLPKKNRLFRHVELDPKLNKAYAKALEELDEVLYGEDGDSFESNSLIIAIYSKLRHITGISKIDDCVDFATEFLISNEGKKLVIFTHHQDVTDILEKHLNEWLESGGYNKCLKLHSGLDSMGRQNLIEKFKEDGQRILLASTLAAGEGLNLQFCSNAVMLERQWNPANEEQAEDRFHRFGQENQVDITYLIASGTIDELFTELVEKKRAIVAGALDGKEISWDSQELFKELAMMLTSRGREKWKL